MKLKEKLAQDYSKGAFNENKRLMDMSYLAGFEKAREMAARIAYSPKFDGTGDEIDTLGEEEV